MPHIHTGSGQIDFTASVFIVYGNKVLLRIHDKYKFWAAPGGHIELDEVPEDAAVREVKEEVGLDVKLFGGDRSEIPNLKNFDTSRELIPPVFMNIHKINDEHRHIDLVYFATTDTDRVAEPDNHEKSDECRWFTKEELLAESGIAERFKCYGTRALEMLGSKL